LGPFVEIELLDTGTEECFDRILRLARVLLPSPISLFSIIDRDNDRQFFKAARGLTEFWAAKRETPLSHSFCKFVQERAETLVVPDAKRDPEFMGNPAVDDLGVRAYLGAPVQNAQGDPIGAICVIDHEPRDWTLQDCDHIRDLAAIASGELRFREESCRLLEAKRVARLGNWSVNKSGLLYWSDEVFEIFGADPAQFDGSSEFFFSFVHPEDAARVVFETELAWQSWERYQTVHAIVRPDGRERIVKENAAVVRSRTGKTLRLSGTVQDITEHLFSGAALRQARSLAQMWKS
jgi:PAS domain S-box-containing protein